MPSTLSGDLFAGPYQEDNAMLVGPMLGWPLGLPGYLDFVNWFIIVLAVCYVPPIAVRLVRKLFGH